MEIRRVFVLGCLLISARLFADIRFIQRISWQADKNALEYRVEVQNTATKKTETVRTTEDFAEFSLAPGEYRYRVSVFNVLGLLSETTAWFPLTVRPSLIPEDGDEAFAQTLSWKTSGDARSYRVEVVNKETHETALFVTDQTSAKLSLDPGTYRYRVTTYDMLGKPGKVGDWVDFSVYKANKPEIKAIEQNVVTADKDGKIVLGVDIANITQGSTVELIRESEEGSFAEHGGGEKGKAGNETDQADSVYFDHVSAGTWRLKVTNPSGLSTESEPFEVQNDPTVVTVVEEPAEIGRKYHSITIAAGGGVWFNPYDGQFLAQNNVTYFGQNLLPAVSAQVQFLPFTAGKHRRDHWGMALFFDGTRLLYRSDAYTQTLTAGMFGANLVYHRALISDYLFLAFRAGGGAVLVQNEVSYKDESGVTIDIGYRREKSRAVSAPASQQSARTVSTASFFDEGTSFFPCARAGLALVWVPFTRLSVEWGATFTHLFIDAMPTGIVTPYLALGIRL